MSPHNLVRAAALGLSLFVAAAAGGGPAFAMGMEESIDVNCLARDALRHYLNRAYGEGRVAQGELDTGNQVELFVSRNGTWTLVEMKAEGLGCVQAYGKHMRFDLSKVPARQSPF